VLLVVTRVEKLDAAAGAECWWVSIARAFVLFWLCSDVLWSFQELAVDREDDW